MRVIAHWVRWNLGLAAAETQTTPAERDCIARHASGRRRLAEIGVWHGVTTCRLRTAMAADGELFAIDPFPVGRLKFSTMRYIAHREVARVHNGHVHWLRITGAEAGALFAARREPPVDFVFIDADHSYQGLRGDWEAWRDLIAPGGIVALHDSRSCADRDIESWGSVQFTRDVILQDPRFVAEDAVDSLTVVRRIAGVRDSSWPISEEPAKTRRNPAQGVRPLMARISQ